MKAVCVDGTEVECRNFKAVDGGVVLTADRKRKTVIGFVPTPDLSYILPDDVNPAQPPVAAVDEAVSTDASGDDGVGLSAAGRDEDTGVDVKDTSVGDVDTDADAVDTEDTAVGDVELNAGGAQEATDDEGAVVAGLVSGAPDAATVAPEQDLRRLAGLGDTYAERLAAAGVNTVSDLRQLSVDEVADAASVPRGRAERWLRLVTARDDEGETDANAENGPAARADTPEIEPSEPE